MILEHVSHFHKAVKSSPVLTIKIDQAHLVFQVKADKHKPVQINSEQRQKIKVATVNQTLAFVIAVPRPLAVFLVVNSRIKE